MHETKSYMQERPTDPRAWRVVGHHLPSSDPCFMRCGRGAAIIEYGDGRRATSAICLTHVCDGRMGAAATIGTQNAQALGSDSVMWYNVLLRAWMCCGCNRPLDRPLGQSLPLFCQCKR